MESFESYFKKLPLFDPLSKDELHKINLLATEEKYNQGEVIINEGELADSLYIITKGSVQIFSIDNNEKIIVLARLDENNYFGETAYLNNLIRTASVKALTEVTLIKITYDSLDSAFNKSDRLKKNFEKKSLDSSISNLMLQLQNVDQCAKDIFTKKGFFSSVEGCSIKHFDKDEIIFKKGDLSDSVYFISTGSVVLSFDEEGADKIIIQKNMIIGEAGVLNNEPRKATAKANTNVTLIVISGKNFLAASKKNSGIQSLTQAFSKIYSLPQSKAIVEQHINKFQDHDAIFSRYQLSSEKTVECVKVINQPIFTIKISNIEPDDTLLFTRGDLIERKVLLKNSLIVGIIAIGEWDEINFLCEMLLSEVKIQEGSKELFIKNGNMLFLSSNSPFYKSDIICNCMAVPYQNIKAKIDEGHNTVEQISSTTGACTACGSCKNKILDILGQSLWGFAKIQINQKFSEDIFSFIIKPLYRKFEPFLAGQFISIKLKINGLWLERTYTLVSQEIHNEYYEIMIRKYDNGMLSPWLFEQANNPLFVWVSRPEGKFLLRQNTKKPILCIAGGIGITPFVAFIRNLKQNCEQKLHLIYIVRNETDVAIPDDVSAILKNSQNIQLKIWNSKMLGLFNVEAAEKTVNSVEPEYVYVCGSTGFQNGVINYLEAMNFDKKNIFTEEFIPAA